MVRLTPNGLSVRPRQRAISFVRSSGVGCVSAVMKPSAPALATAATSSARPTHCMPPWTIGCSTPNVSVNLVFMGCPFLRGPRQVARDDHALDLVGAFEYLHDLGLAHHALDREVGGVA